MQANQIRFGVEVECFVPADVAATHFRAGGYHHGQPVQGLDFVEGDWSCQSDSSLMGAPEGYVPVEVVSPILSGEQGVFDAFYLVDVLREARAVVNSHCGLHVHVDATHLSPEQVDRITDAFCRYEAAFYGLSGGSAPARMSSHYCRPSSAWQRDMTTGRPVGSRYQSLNLTNWARTDRTSKRTLEIRCWAGTMNPEEVLTAIYMAVSLVARAIDTHDADGPIATCTDAARQFAASYLQPTEYRILPEDDVEDMTALLLQRCRQADRAIRRQTATV